MFLPNLENASINKWFTVESLSFTLDLGLYGVILVPPTTTAATTTVGLEYLSLQCFASSTYTCGPLFSDTISLVLIFVFLV